MINVVLIDDHVMVREGIKQLLELDGDVKVVGCAGDGLEGLRVVEETKPDVILLDINMPNMNGISFLAKLNQTQSKKKVLVLTIHNEIEYLYKALDYDVDGYVLKDSELSILKKAILSIHVGEKYYQEELAPLVIDYNKGKKKTNDLELIQKLTEREIQVLTLVTKGINNREIGEQLEISEKTVKNHLSSIFKKIGINDRTLATVFAIKNNIVDI